MQELISVIVPIYNAQGYLHRCVDALIGQTYQNIEIILVNDGSTDQSGEICNNYAKKDTRIRVIHKENGGSSTARNKGISEARGVYIGFNDCDDYAEPDLYENLYQVMQEHPDAVISQAMSSDYTQDGVLVKGPYKDSGTVTYLPKEEMFRLLMLHVGDSSFCTKLIKAEYMKQFRFPEGHLNEDFELVLRMLTGVKGVYSLEKNGYNIELRFGNNSRNSFRKVFYDSMIQNSNFAYKMMQEQFPQFEEEAQRFCFFQRLDYLLHIPVSYMNKENVCYTAIIKEIKAGRGLIRQNKYLTKKEKRNLLILSRMPRFSKRMHSVVMFFKRKLGKV